jgi:hypothetical protein
LVEVKTACLKKQVTGVSIPSRQIRDGSERSVAVLTEVAPKRSGSRLAAMYSLHGYSAMSLGVEAIAVRTADTFLATRISLILFYKNINHKSSYGNKQNRHF